MIRRISQFTLKSSITGISGILALLTLIGKGFGLFREVLYASNFGLKNEFDLFLIGSVLTISINTAVYYLAQHYLIPGHSNKKNLSDEEAKLFFLSSFRLFIFFSVLLSLMLFLFSTNIIELFINSSYKNSFEIANKIFIIFLLTIPVNSGISIISAFLQSNHNFIFPALIQLLINVIVVLTVFLFSKSYGIITLPVSFVISYVIGFLILLFKVRNNFSPKLNHFPKFNLSFSIPKSLLILMTIEILSLSYSFFDRYYFEQLETGGISALNYAMTLFTLPISVISISLITVLFPKFSESSNIAQDSNQRLHSIFKKSIDVTVFLLVPIAILAIYFGRDFIKIFYERGSFTSWDTELTYMAFRYYSISLVFYSMYLVLVKLFYSQLKYSIILYISIIGFVIKILFNYLFIDSLKQNGLALSTTLVYISQYLISIIAYYYLINKNDKYFSVSNFIFSLCNALLTIFLTTQIVELFNFNTFMHLMISTSIFTILYTCNYLILSNKKIISIKRSSLIAQYE